MAMNLNSPLPSIKGGKKLKVPVPPLTLTDKDKSAAQALQAAQRQLSERNLSDETTIFCNGESIHVRAADFQYVEMLGRGQYGEVEKMLHAPTKREFAVKKLRTSVQVEEQKTTLTDLDVSMRASACPYMIKFYGALFREGDVWLIMDLMDTSFDKFYKEVYAQNLEIPEDLLGVISYCVLQALEYMRSKLAKMHRDIKPSNILVDRTGNVKLCDFGISGELVNSIANSNIGCKPYMAPERITNANGGYTIKTDVWSFGITMYELATGTFPYKEWDNVFQQLSDVVHGPAPRLPDSSTRSRAFREFVHSCLDKDVRSRPKYAELLKSQFMQGYQLPSYTDSSYKQHRFVVQLADFVRQVLRINAYTNGQ